MIRRVAYKSIMRPNSCQAKWTQTPLRNGKKNDCYSLCGQLIAFEWVKIVRTFSGGRISAELIPCSWMWSISVSCLSSPTDNSHCFWWDGQLVLLLPLKPRSSLKPQILSIHLKKWEIIGRFFAGEEMKMKKKQGFPPPSIHMYFFENWNCE